jgi:hypothetical protein
VDLATALQLISTIALVAGVLFAGVQWRAARIARTRETQIQLLRSFDSPEFMRAFHEVVELPDGLSKAEVDALGPERVDRVWYWLGLMESIGELVHERAIPLELVDNTFGGPILISWRKLSGFCRDTRTQWKRDTMEEWFEWLVNRLAELERDEGRTPAYVREADWKP